MKQMTAIMNEIKRDFVNIDILHFQFDFCAIHEIKQNKLYKIFCRFRKRNCCHVKLCFV